MPYCPSGPRGSEGCIVQNAQAPGALGGITPLGCSPAGASWYLLQCLHFSDSETGLAGFVTLSDSEGANVLKIKL